MSVRAQKAVGRWSMLFQDRINAIVEQVRNANREYEDPILRRLLCDLLFVADGRDVGRMSEDHLRETSRLMEANIRSRGVRDSDVRLWFKTYRRLPEFQPDAAIDTLTDWENVSPGSRDTAFYLYVLYFVRWLQTDRRNTDLAQEFDRWLTRCRERRLIGDRRWSYEWLGDLGRPMPLIHFRDLPTDPAHSLRNELEEELATLESALNRVTGVMSDYRGPQHAVLDLGEHVQVSFMPLKILTEEDVGKRVTVWTSFSYDGPRGWRPKLCPSRTSRGVKEC